jgi:hypothetical protein
VQSLLDFKTAAGFAFVDTMEFGVLPDVINSDDKLLVEFRFTAGVEEWTCCPNVGNELIQVNYSYFKIPFSCLVNKEMYIYIYSYRSRSQY